MHGEKKKAAKVASADEAVQVIQPHDKYPLPSLTQKCIAEPWCARAEEIRAFILSSLLFIKGIHS